MNLRNSPRTLQPNFVVAKTGTSIYNTGGTHINTTGGNVILANGQLGFFDATGFGSNGINNALATATVAQSPAIYIAQGTPDSANVAGANVAYPLSVRPFVKTQSVYGNNVHSVTKSIYKEARHNTWVIGKPIANAQAIKAYSMTEYSIGVAYRGVVSEEFYSAEQAWYSTHNYVTPDYSAAGLNLTAAQAVDDIVQHLAYDVNMKSLVFKSNYTARGGNYPILAFAIRNDGTIGVKVADITTSTELVLANTPSGYRKIKLTAAQLASLVASVTAAGFATATARVLTIDLATAGTGTNGLAEGIVLLALDRKPAYKDYESRVKTIIEVGLNKGFDYMSTYCKDLVPAFEGQNDGKSLLMFYKETDGQRQYLLRHVEDPIIEYPAFIEEGLNYTMYSILHEQREQINFAHMMTALKQEIVLIPSTETAQQTAFETFLNGYLASANKTAIKTW